jgi:hypothetical protein
VVLVLISCSWLIKRPTKGVITYIHPLTSRRIHTPDPFLLKLWHLESKLLLKGTMMQLHTLLHTLLVHHMPLLTPILGVVALELKIGKSLPLQLERCLI